MTPEHLRVRMFDAGFGDCVLVTAVYQRFARHMLIDFGTTQPPDAELGVLVRMARAIEESVRSPLDGQLDAIVATHRHRDHIGGFARGKSGQWPGDVIAKLKPLAVIRPWMENATGNHLAAEWQRSAKAHLAGPNGLLALLDREARRFQPALRRDLEMHAARLEPNRFALAGLQSFGARQVFAGQGDELSMEERFPGVRFEVLGPARPGAASWGAIETEAAADESGVLGAGGLFPGWPNCPPEEAPPEVRWLLERLDQLRSEQLLMLLANINRTINNSSVILLIKCGKHTLLFPGDAQPEAWAQALGTGAARRGVAATTVYKVSHHGSRDATPPGLWSLFKHRDRGLANTGARNRVRMQPGGLTALLSTQKGMHGDEWRGNEIPSRPLVARLRGSTQLIDTRALRRAKRDWVDVLLDPVSGGVEVDTSVAGADRDAA